MIEFFIPLKKIPTVTSQQKGINGRGDKPVIYTKQELLEVKAMFMSRLMQFIPEKHYDGAVRLTTKWLYPDQTGRHRDGEYKITKPDTDNTVKLFKDCMTAAGFWLDDAQVASEITEKFWVRESPSGIYVRVEELP